MLKKTYEIIGFFLALSLNAGSCLPGQENPVTLAQAVEHFKKAYIQSGTIDLKQLPDEIVRLDSLANRYPDDIFPITGIYCDYLKLIVAQIKQNSQGTWIFPKREADNLLKTIDDAVRYTVLTDLERIFLMKIRYRLYLLLYRFAGYQMRFDQNLSELLARRKVLMDSLTAYEKGSDSAWILNDSGIVQLKSPVSLHNNLYSDSTDGIYYPWTCLREEAREILQGLRTGPGDEYWHVVPYNENESVLVILLRQDRRFSQMQINAKTSGSVSWNLIQELRDEYRYLSAAFDSLPDSYSVVFKNYYRDIIVYLDKFEALYSDRFQRLSEVYEILYSDTPNKYNKALKRLNEIDIESGNSYLINKKKFLHAILTYLTSDKSTQYAKKSIEDLESISNDINLHWDVLFAQARIARDARSNRYEMRDYARKKFKLLRDWGFPSAGFYYALHLYEEKNWNEALFEFICLKMLCEDSQRDFPYFKTYYEGHISGYIKKLPDIKTTGPYAFPKKENAFSLFEYEYFDKPPVDALAISAKLFDEIVRILPLPRLSLNELCMLVPVDLPKPAFYLSVYLCDWKSNKKISRDSLDIQPANELYRTRPFLFEGEYGMEGNYSLKVKRAEGDIDTNIQHRYGIDPRNRDVILYEKNSPFIPQELLIQMGPIQSANDFTIRGDTVCVSGIGGVHCYKFSTGQTIHAIITNDSDILLSPHFYPQLPNRLIFTGYNRNRVVIGDRSLDSLKAHPIKCMPFHFYLPDTFLLIQQSVDYPISLLTFNDRLNYYGVLMFNSGKKDECDRAIEDVYFDQQNNQMYLCDASNEKILKSRYNRSTNTIGSPISVITKHLNNPFRLAIYFNHIIVLDMDKKIKIFSPDGRYVFSIGDKILDDPVAVQSINGSIFVLDRKAKKIFKFMPNN